MYPWMSLSIPAKQIPIFCLLFSIILFHFEQDLKTFKEKKQPGSAWVILKQHPACTHTQVCKPAVRFAAVWAASVMKPQLETDWVRDSPRGSRAELKAQRGADSSPHADKGLCSHRLPYFHTCLFLRRSVRSFCLMSFFALSFHHFVSNHSHFHESLSRLPCRCQV